MWSVILSDHLDQLLSRESPESEFSKLLVLGSWPGLESFWVDKTADSRISDPSSGLICTGNLSLKEWANRGLRQIEVKTNMMRRQLKRNGTHAFKACYSTDERRLLCSFQGISWTGLHQQKRDSPKLHQNPLWACIFSESAGEGFAFADLREKSAVPRLILEAFRTQRAGKVTDPSLGPFKCLSSQ